MSQSMDRLKELLFEKESRELSDLRQRLVALGDDGRLEREKLKARIDALFERAGSRDLMRAAVAELLEDAIIDAESHRPEELRRALAPVVVGTVKTEIVNNKDLLVQTLSPRMGEMIKSYIASAMKDLMAQINRKLENAMPGSGRKLRAKARAAGMSVAELALAETQKLQVDEIYLVRRGSGQVLKHWSREPADIDGDGALSPAMGDNRNTLVGGFLTAITSFAQEAFEADNSSLRALQHEDFQIYLRQSPAYLLAARCTGTPLPGIETAIDEEFMRIMSTHDDLLSALSAGTAGLNGMSGAQNGANGSAGASNGSAGVLLSEAALEEMLPSLAGSLEARMAQKHDALFAVEPSRSNPLKMIAIGVGVPLLALLGWFGWQGYWTAWTQDRVQQVIDQSPAMTGYPVRLDVASGGSAVKISALVPSAPVKQALVKDIKAAVPGVAIADALSVIPQAKQIDPEPRIAEVRRDLTALDQRASAKLTRLAEKNAEDLTRLEALSAEKLNRLKERNAKELSRLQELSAKAIDSAQHRNRQSLIDLERQFVLAGITRAVARAQRRLDTVIPELTALKERLGTDPAAAVVGAALEHVRSAKADVAVLSDEIAKPGTKPAAGGALATRLNQATARINAASASLGALRGVVAADVTTDSKPQRPDESAENLSLAAERFAIVSTGAARTIVLKPVERSLSDISTSVTGITTSFGTLQRRVDELTPGARQRLQAWIRTNAIFFANKAQFRNRSKAAAKLDKLAALLRQTTVSIRVVGYTDSTGAAGQNAALALQRGRTVSAELAARRIKKQRIITIGRTNGPDLDASSGLLSANRRVQFEITFDGERAGGR